MSRNPKLQKVLERLKLETAERRIISVNVEKKYYDKVVGYLKEQGIENGFSKVLNAKLKELAEEVDQIKKEEEENKKDHIKK